MKRLFAWGTALLLVGGMQAASLPVDEPITPVDYVSTLVGTQSSIPFLRVILILPWLCLGA